VTTPSRRDRSYPWPLRIAAGLAYTLAVLLCCTVAGGGTAALSTITLLPVGAPIRVAEHSNMSPVAIDVLRLRLSGDRWTIEKGQRASSAFPPGQRWLVTPGWDERAPELDGRTSIGIPLAARTVDRSSGAPGGLIMNGRFAELSGDGPSWVLDVREPRLAAPYDAWLICARQPDAPAPASLADWRALVASELGRMAKMSRAERESRGLERHTYNVCRMAALLGVTEAEEALQVLRPQLPGWARAYVDVVSGGSTRRSPLEDVREVSWRSGVDRDVALAALAGNDALRPAVRDAARAELDDLLGKTAGPRTWLARCCAMVLLVLFLALRATPLRRLHRELSVVVFAGGLALAFARHPVAPGVAAPAVGLALAATTCFTHLPSRRGRVAAVLLGATALGHLVAGPRPNPFADTVLGGAVFLALVAIPPAPAMPQIGTPPPAPPPRRPARGLGALPTVLAILVLAGIGASLSFVLMPDGWFRQSWPRSIWDAAVWLAAAPLFGHLAARGGSARSTFLSMLLALAALHLGAWHISAVVAGIFHGESLPYQLLPAELGVLALYVVVAGVALQRVIRWVPHVSWQPGSAKLTARLG
jgi:hypothetical protein